MSGINPKKVKHDFSARSLYTFPEETYIFPCNLQQKKINVTIGANISVKVIKLLQRSHVGTCTCMTLTCTPCYEYCAVHCVMFFCSIV